MLNPVVDNVWTRGDLKFTFAEDFATITIEQNGQTVVIRGNDITDAGTLMDAAFRAEENDDLSSRMLYNMVGTSKSLPNCEWGDLG